jgi:hypothetical protein
MLMIEGFLAFAIVTLAILCVVILLFLPAIRELTKPADAGPRVISDNSAEKAINQDKKLLME